MLQQATGHKNRQSAEVRGAMRAASVHVQVEQWKRKPASEGEARGSDRRGSRRAPCEDGMYLSRALEESRNHVSVPFPTSAVCTYVYSSPLRLLLPASRNWSSLLWSCCGYLLESERIFLALRNLLPVR